MDISEDEILEKLRDIEDPELHVNIVDLGLIYDVDITDEDVINVEMTFTTPFCPFGASLEQSVRDLLEETEDVKEVNVKVVFDPPWGTHLMSEEAKLELGII